MKTCVTYTIKFTRSFQQMTWQVGANLSFELVSFLTVGLGIVIGSRTDGMRVECDQYSPTSMGCSFSMARNRAAQALRLACRSSSVTRTGA